MSLASQIPHIAQNLNTDSCIYKVLPHVPIQSHINPIQDPPSHFLNISFNTIHLLGGIQNIPEWCGQVYRSCGSAKHRSQQAKPGIPGSTAMFYGDCMKMCKNVALNFGENRPRCFTMTTSPLTLPSSPSNFWRKTK
jgi:hypothetical protein